MTTNGILLQIHTQIFNFVNFFFFKYCNLTCTPDVDYWSTLVKYGLRDFRLHLGNILLGKLRNCWVNIMMLRLQSDITSVEQAN